MKREEILEKFKGGFVFRSKKHRICDVEAILGEEEIEDNKLVFLLYDANLCPLPDYSTWKNRSAENKQIIERGLQVTSDFEGEVWIDDVRIK